MSKRQICDATSLDEIYLWTFGANHTNGGLTSYAACAADNAASLAAVPARADAAQQFK